jgi:hypothetical protein
MIATLCMPTTFAASGPCTQAFMVEALAQKSRAGGFPPPFVVIFNRRKFLYKQQPTICNALASQGGEVNSIEIKCL